MFLLAYQITQSSSFLVGFLLDGGSQLLTKFTQYSLHGSVLESMHRHLADMTTAAMNALQQGQERFTERFVIVGASAPTRRLELHILYPA